jgi:transposase
MTAPMVLDGPMNGPAFLAYVKQMLVPKLQPGETVVMDKLAAYRVGDVQAAIEVTGAHLRLLSPYSPDSNPFENAIAKLKTSLRQAVARTIPDLWNTIADALPAFSPTNCANYFIAAHMSCNEGFCCSLPRLLDRILNTAASEEHA